MWMFGFAREARLTPRNFRTSQDVMALELWKLSVRMRKEFPSEIRSSSYRRWRAEFAIAARRDKTTNAIVLKSLGPSDRGPTRNLLRFQTPILYRFRTDFHSRKRP